MRSGLVPFFEAIDAALWVAPEPPSPVEFVDNGPDRWQEMIAAREHLASIARAATELRRSVDRQLAEELGTGGAARWGESIYRPTPRRTLRAIDEPGWWAFLVGALGVVPSRRDRAIGLLSRLYRAADVRLTPLRELAETTGTEEGAIRDSFFAWEVGPLEVSAIPIDRAPKYLQKLAEGEALIRRLAWPIDIEEPSAAPL
jgi:hypothetical protein